MSWRTWRHPNMPWVTTEAWVGDILSYGTIGDSRRVAGGPDESVFQPEWSPHGEFYFVSDRGSGWWNLYRERDGVALVKKAGKRSQVWTKYIPAMMAA
jgi:hypothetical protein